MNTASTLLNCSGPLAVLALCLHPAIATAREPGLDDVIAQINAAVNNLSDVSCTMIEQFDPPWVPPETTRLQLAVPDRVRATTTDEYGNERIVVKNGNVEWRVADPMNVSKTVWADGGVPYDSPIPVLGTRTYRLLRDAVSSTTREVVDRIDYQGVERIDGLQCHVLDTRGGQVRTWIAAEDGLIRRQERRVAGGRHITRFKDVEVNTGLDDRLFHCQPEEGARVEVAELVDGHWRRSHYHVPHTTVPKAAQRETQPMLSEVQARFDQNERFSCRLVETVTRHDMYAVSKDGERIQLGHRKVGTLLVEPPMRVRMEVEQVNNGMPGDRSLLVISDGYTIWRCDRDMADPGPRVVSMDRLLPFGSLQSTDRAQRTSRSEPPNGYDLAADLPPFILSPLGGIALERIAFEGDEVLQGEPTYRFSVKAADRDYASTHWIGASDGIPRRVEVMSLLGNFVERTIALSDVQIDPVLPDDAFTLEEDESVTVFDMAEMRTFWRRSRKDDRSG